MGMIDQLIEKKTKEEKMAKKLYWRINGDELIENLLISSCKINHLLDSILLLNMAIEKKKYPSYKVYRVLLTQFIKKRNKQKILQLYSLYNKYKTFTVGSESHEKQQADTQNHSFYSNNGLSSSPSQDSADPNQENQNQEISEENYDSFSTSSKDNDLSIFISMMKYYKSKNMYRDALFLYECSYEYSKTQNAIKYASSLGTQISFFNITLDISFRQKDFQLAKKILEQIVQSGLKLDSYSYDLLIYGYGYIQGRNFVYF